VPINPMISDPGELGTTLPAAALWVAELAAPDDDDVLLPLVVCADDPEEEEDVTVEL